MTAWGNVAEWVSGIGALTAAGVAVFVSVTGSKDAHRIAQEAADNAQDIAREDRRAAARDRTAGLLVELVRAVEADIRAYEDRDAWRSSVEGEALCRALWGHRNQFGTVWDMYCADGWPFSEDVLRSGELFRKMRGELQSALDSLDHQDR